MRTSIAAYLVASLFTVLFAPLAQAAPAEVNVRIEGKTETLFEGPVITDGHSIRASSDSAAPPSGRPCDGTNNGRNPSPGPTPTAASVDAMSILGEDFDGQWYPGYDDYFIERWGPEAQDEGQGEYWGVLVNDAFSNVGGCQYRLDGGDEVLWVYDAFEGRPELALFPVQPTYTSGPRPLTATAQRGAPFAVEVVAYEDDVESVPPAAAGRAGSNPYEGAEVAPVKVSAKGFESVDTEDPETNVTGSDGRASMVFDTVGWHRIKATQTAPGGAEVAIRSNRLDICVIDPPGVTDCGPPPPDDLARTPLSSEEEEAGDGGGGEGEASGDDDRGQGGSVPGAASGAGAPAPAPAGSAPVRLRLSRLDRSRVSRGVVGVSWRLLDQGVGLHRWAISAKALGRKGARFVTRATGTRGSSASLHLSPGAYRLQLTVVDALGRRSSARLGQVRIPR